MTEIDVRGVRVEFPFEPYPAQLEFMHKAMESFQRGVHALLESPTGTGKTLCLLCAAAAFVLSQRPPSHPLRRTGVTNDNTHANPGDGNRNTSKSSSSSAPLSSTGGGTTLVSSSFASSVASEKEADAHGTATPLHATPSPSPATRGCFVVYCSRTHAQLTHVIRELKRTRYAANLTMALLGSREHMCVNAEVLRLPSQQAQQSMCNTLRAERGCRFYRGLHSGKTTHALLDEAKAIHDIEDLLREGRRCGFCPYYYERQAASSADMIFMPYNYIVDPLLRRQLPFDLKQCILIIDEAHNLPGVLSSAGCLNLHPLDLTNAIHDCTRAMAALRLLSSGTGSEAEDKYSSHSRRNSNYSHSHSNNHTSHKNEAAVADDEEEIAALKIVLCRLEKCIAEEDVVAARCSGGRSDRGSSATAASAPLCEPRPRMNDGTLLASELVCAGSYMFTFLARALITRDVMKGECAYKSSSGDGTSDGGGLNEVINKAILVLAESDRPASGLVKVQRFLDEVFATDEECVVGKDGTLLPSSTRFVIQELPDTHGHHNVQNTNHTHQKGNNRSACNGSKHARNASSAVSTASAARRVLGFWKLDNSSQLQALATPLRALILTSGTLSPMNHFAAELGVEFAVQLCGQHVIGADQVLATVLCRGPARERLNGSYAFRNSADYRLGMGMSLLNICRHTPGGTLVFFASYVALHSAVDLWKANTGRSTHAVHATHGGTTNTATATTTTAAAAATLVNNNFGSIRTIVTPNNNSHSHGNSNDRSSSDKNASSDAIDGSTGARTLWGMLSELKPIFIEPADGANLSLVMTEFQRSIDRSPQRGALLLAVCRGKVSEGVDFADHHGRCVVIAGIPFANQTDLFVRLKKSFFTAVAPHRPLVHGRCFTGMDWYRNEAMRAVNQCLGRVIRHKDDYGAVVLADERFADQMEALSTWVRTRTVVHNEFRETNRAVAHFFARHHRKPGYHGLAGDDDSGEMHRDGGLFAHSGVLGMHGTLGSNGSDASMSSSSNHVHKASLQAHAFAQGVRDAALARACAEQQRRVAAAQEMPERVEGVPAAVARPPVAWMRSSAGVKRARLASIDEANGKRADSHQAMNTSSSSVASENVVHTHNNNNNNNNNTKSCADFCMTSHANSCGRMNATHTTDTDRRMPTCTDVDARRDCSRAVPNDVCTLQQSGACAAVAAASGVMGATSREFSGYLKSHLSAASYAAFKSVLKELAQARVLLTHSPAKVQTSLAHAVAQLRLLFGEVDVTQVEQLMREFGRHIPTDFRTYYAHLLCNPPLQ